MENRLLQILSVKLFTAEISNAEKEKLNKMIESSDANRREFEKLKLLWNYSQPADFGDIPDADTEWLELNKKLQHEIRPGFWAKLSESLRPVLQPGLKPAIGMSFAVLIVFSALLYFSSNTGIPEMKTLTALNGEVQEISLADGSLVKLNSGSFIEYPEEFSGAIREVKLSGEAFFSIAKDSHHPFIVRTENASTKVLGTKFNVWSRNSETRVIVAEGRVSLSPKENSGNGVILTKNQTSEVIDNSDPKNAVEIDADYMLGWLDGKLVFNQTPVSEILGELERRFDTEIEIENSALQSETVTAAFDSKNIDDVLQMLSLTLGARVEKQNGAFFLKELENK